VGWEKRDRVFLRTDVSKDKEKGRSQQRKRRREQEVKNQIARRTKRKTNLGLVTWRGEDTVTCFLNVSNRLRARGRGEAKHEENPERLEGKEVSH